MARVLKGSHSFTCTPTRSSAIGMSHTCLCLPSYSWYSFTDPGGMEGWVGLGGWLRSLRTVLATLTTSASQSLASLAGHVFVRLNAMTGLSLRHLHSLVEWVSMLQPQPSGTRFHHIFAHHPSVVDSSGLGWKPISSHRPTNTSENFCWRAYFYIYIYSSIEKTIDL